MKTDELITTQFGIPSLPAFSFTNFAAFVFRITFSSFFPFCCLCYRFALRLCLVYILFSITTHFGDQTDVAAVPVDTCVDALPGADIIPEGGSAPAMISRSQVVDWSVADNISRCVIYLDAHRFSTMFSNSNNVTTYNRRSLKRKIDISGWNHRWEVLQFYCPHDVDPIATLGMKMVILEDESSYVLRLVTLVEHAETVRSLPGLEA